MIELYYWPTPNGHKITMFLEETGIPYSIRPVDIGKGEQFAPDFLRIAPNNRMPAIIDDAPVGGGPPISVFESGAILMYLAQKHRVLRPDDVRGQVEVMQWLFWQVANLGPVAGNNHHFVGYADEKVQYAIDRFVNETSRLYAVLDRRLRDRPFVAGGNYTIADIAIYPWTVSHARQRQNLDDFPNLRRWFDAIAARPATLRAYALGPKYRPSTEMSADAKKILFGQSAETLRKLQ